ncbi:MAG: galactose mutarotase [Bacteroidales bacterium]|nr:galactose mutarotase [Bacteroidales bacterium]
MKKIFFAAMVLLMSACCKQAPQLYTIKNSSGMEVSITNYGGRIVSLMVPDRNGELRDVVLGFDTLTDYYPENNETDFGASIGRYANRIKDGRITIDGKEYQLPRNNYGHCLHGGTRGWQYQFYNAVKVSENSLKLERISPDGDQNFPGNVKACVTFTVQEDNKLDIRYEATTDAPTVINMTNHAYFNLSGDPAGHSVLEDELYINASAFTPVDDTFMTTGEIWPVEGTPMDFRTPKPVGQDIDADYEQLRNGHGYDHNWVLDTAGDDTAVAASLYSPFSGIELRVYTDEPGIQVYSGNFLDGTVTGKGGVVYGHRTAVCLETQKFPDTPNKPQWPSAMLRPGETYTSHCVFEFVTK